MNGAPQLIHAINLGTAVLGLFMALPLMLLARRRRENFWLGLFVLSLSLLSLADFAYNAGLRRAFPVLRGVFEWPLACLGASFYCYVRGMVGLGNGRRQAWHAAPLLLWILFLLQLGLLGEQAWRPRPAPMLLGFQMLTAGYALAVLVRLHAYRRRLRLRYSAVEGRDLVWVTMLSLVMLALLVLWMTATALGGPWRMGLQAGRIGVLYFVGWYGMRQAPAFLEPLAAGAALADSAKYARSGMTGAAAELIGQRLARRQQVERDYLDSDIKLADLAERIGTSPQLLSEFLNDVLGVNFFDYINGLRVAEVQRMMGEPGAAGRALTDLAFAAGFNSRSTFSASFKKSTGMTPSAWRRQHVRTSLPIGPDS